MNPKTVVALDLSSSPGLAALRGTHGNVQVLETAHKKWAMKKHAYPYGWQDAATEVAQWTVAFCERHSPEAVYIEETNGSRQRFTQKILEWIHWAVLDALRKAGYADRVRYIDTGDWRRELGITLSKEDRKNNAKVSKAKKSADVREAKKALGVTGRKTAKHLAVEWANTRYGLALKLKDNDIADALCLGTAGLSPSIRFSEPT